MAIDQMPDFVSNQVGKFIVVKCLKGFRINVDYTATAIFCDIYPGAGIKTLPWNLEKDLQRIGVP